MTTETKTAYNKAYHLANREKILARKRKNAKGKKEHNRLRMRTYRTKNSKQVRLYENAYRERNREYLNAQQRARYAKKDEEEKAKLHVHRLRRRARIAHAPVVERVSITIIYKRDQHICSLCQKTVKRKDASIDHIVPLVDGGEHSFRNCALAHRSCNVRKRTSTRFPQQLRLF